MKMDANKASSFFQKLLPVNLEEEKRKEEVEKGLFFDLMYQKISPKEVENISIEHLVGMLDDVGSFLGGKGQNQLFLEEIIDSLNRCESEKRMHRVL